ncbi:MAG: hypothetical protein GWP41_07380 [Planctomycetia bacterium]|nr:hypothetical protein [Planctomycetia bacterium]NCG12610.1 hypothetical protein [Planctomycetia bacterium]NCG57481.1 hypothetical protein [Pseudomonadota bacterium]
MAITKILILGNGPELRRVLSVLESDPEKECVGCVFWKVSDPSNEAIDPSLGMHFWRGTAETLQELIAAQSAKVAIAISSAQERWKALSLLNSLSIIPEVLISEGASVDDNVIIGAGSVIHQGVILEEGVRIGHGCLLLPGSRMGVGSRCGDACIMESGSQVEDMGRLGDEVHLGTRTVVLSERIVGPRSLILPGSIVTSDVESGVIVSGTPASVIESSTFSE